MLKKMINKNKVQIKIIKNKIKRNRNILLVLIIQILNKAKKLIVMKIKAKEM